MRMWHRAAAAAAALLTIGSITGAVAQAGTTPSTLYVSRASTCSDSGGGSKSTPFCTIQAAANVVDPGQTILIDSSYTYKEAVTLTRSGESGAPVTITTTTTATPGAISFPVVPTLDPTNSGAVALTLSAVHDVAISHFMVWSSPEVAAVDVIGSHDVTLDSSRVVESNNGTASGTGVVIDGSSSRVTLSRSDIRSDHGYGVQVQPGASGIIVTTNVIMPGRIQISGASAAVTSNSIVAVCSAGVEVNGAGAAVVENNHVRAISYPCPSSEWEAISVAADSVDKVHVDYNALMAEWSATEYSWGGTTYTNAADFASATGQGAHDIDTTTPPDTSALTIPEGSTLIDSADPNAPGELTTDLTGYPRIDDPSVPNAAGGYADRGAFERECQLAVVQTVNPSDAKGIAPFTVTVQAHVTNVDPGSQGLFSYTFDFGDNTASVANTAGTASHTYTKSGSFTETTKVTVANAATWAPYGTYVQTVTQQVSVWTPNASAAVIEARPDYYDDPETGSQSIRMGSVDFDVSGPDAWEAAADQVDFGDGTSATAVPGTPLVHSYPGDGGYTATLSQTDVLGRTSSAQVGAVAGGGFKQDPTKRVYDSRSTGKQVPSHGVVKLSLKDFFGADYAGVDAATVTVTVTGPKVGGYIGVYPDGSTAGTVSSVNFAAGQTIANEVNAVPGSNGVVDFYNGSGGPVDLIVDVFGELSNGNGTSGRDTYVPVSPVRVLDTRNGTGAAKAAVGAGRAVTLQVAGRNGVPANADAVVLNVAVTDTRAGGYFTAYGEGISRPGTSNGNWAAGQTISNLAVVPLHDGKVVLYNGSGGTSDFVTDLVGFYNKDGVASVFVPLSPKRLLDTRTGTGTGGRVAKLGAGQTLTVGVPSVAGWLYSSAVAINLTVTNTSTGGYLTACPDGQSRGGTSSLNFAAGQVVANMAIVPVSPYNTIAIYNGSGHAVDVVVDEFGSYYSYPVT